MRPTCSQLSGAFNILRAWLQLFKPGCVGAHNATKVVLTHDRSGDKGDIPPIFWGYIPKILGKMKCIKFFENLMHFIMKKI